MKYTNSSNYCMHHVKLTLPGVASAAEDEVIPVCVLDGVNSNEDEEIVFLRVCSGANFSKMAFAVLYVSVSITLSKTFRFSSFKIFSLF